MEGDAVADWGMKVGRRGSRGAGEAGAGAGEAVEGAERGGAGEGWSRGVVVEGAGAGEAGVVGAVERGGKEGGPEREELGVLRVAVKVGAAGGGAWWWQGSRWWGSWWRRDGGTGHSRRQASGPSRQASEQHRACPRRECTRPHPPAPPRIHALTMPRPRPAPHGGGAEERGAGRRERLDRRVSRVERRGGGGGGVSFSLSLSRSLAPSLCSYISGPRGPRTRDSGSGGRSDGTAVRPWRWRRPVRCCFSW